MSEMATHLTSVFHRMRTLKVHKEVSSVFNKLVPGNLQKQLSFFNKKGVFVLRVRTSGKL